MSKNSQCSVDNIEGSCSQKWRHWTPMLVQSAPGKNLLCVAQHRWGCSQHIWAAQWQWAPATVCDEE